MLKPNLNPGTLSVWAGEEEATYNATQVPVVHSVSFGYKDVNEWLDVALGRKSGHIYGRNTNPTVDVFEEKIRQLEGAQAATSAATGMGIISSLVGISGGILSTPLQQQLLRLPLKNSIANSITAAVFCSATSASLLLFVGLRTWTIPLGDVLVVSACLVPGNVAGAQLGSYLTKITNVNYIRVLFAVVAAVIGFRILLFQ